MSRLPALDGQPVANAPLPWRGDSGRPRVRDALQNYTTLGAETAKKHDPSMATSAAFSQTGRRAARVRTRSSLLASSSVFDVRATSSANALGGRNDGAMPAPLRHGFTMGEQRLTWGEPDGNQKSSAGSSQWTPRRRCVEGKLGEFRGCFFVPATPFSWAFAGFSCICVFIREASSLNPFHWSRTYG